MEPLERLLVRPPLSLARVEQPPKQEVVLLAREQEQPRQPFALAEVPVARELDEVHAPCMRLPLPPPDELLQYAPP